MEIKATKVASVRSWKPGENTVLFVGGSEEPYHCETPTGFGNNLCRANVFKKLDEEGAYKCNGGCGVVIREGSKS